MVGTDALRRQSLDRTRPVNSEPGTNHKRGGYAHHRRSGEIRGHQPPDGKKTEKFAGLGSRQAIIPTIRIKIHDPGCTGTTPCSRTPKSGPPSTASPHAPGY